ncbi:unnamed protein product [Ranitomeya imitator]|uniref:Lysosomal amino acid transporter 1 homolog n=1 Tax=Ranitomeya imitator TaxID=111125 RepID=A0ABN9MPB2_9NEOB|nr:unnamed protein product [Ranitomeya imitator]
MRPPFCKMAAPREKPDGHREAGQLYVAHKNGRVDQALSLGFLFCWFGGDVTNFVGSYLTKQLPIQVVTAICYVSMDIIMISQFAYYKLKHKKLKALCSASLLSSCTVWEPESRAVTSPLCFPAHSQYRRSAEHSAGGQTAVGSTSLKGFCIGWVVLCITLSVILPSQLLLRNMERIADVEQHSLGVTEMSGFICGYVSSVFYLGSRFPQLHKNFQKKSTEGLSYMLFALAMLGNFTYGLSLMLKLPSVPYSKNRYILHHLPWLIGSFGVLVLDFFMTAQFIFYRKHRTTQSNLLALEVEPLLVDEEET